MTATATGLSPPPSAIDVIIDNKGRPSVYFINWLNEVFQKSYDSQTKMGALSAEMSGIIDAVSSVDDKGFLQEINLSNLINVVQSVQSIIAKQSANETELQLLISELSNEINDTKLSCEFNDSQIENIKSSLSELRRKNASDELLNIAEHDPSIENIKRELRDIKLLCEMNF